METLWDRTMATQASTTRRTTAEKLALFRQCFTGRTDVYGTYDPRSGKTWLVKAPVTDAVLLAHLKGERPYGVYPLVGKLTRLIAADFDSQDRGPPKALVDRAKHYGLQAYIERSKSKGYHGWVFFEEKGVWARDARLVLRHLLEEIEMPNLELFPKQDALGGGVRYGSFINVPFFGALVPEGRSVFVHPHTFQPFANQWDFLESIARVSQQRLDEIIEINDLVCPAMPGQTDEAKPNPEARAFGLPPCAKKMLEAGVTENQRVACFRLAVQLKKLGLPQDIALGALKAWAFKNRPRDGRRVITVREIREQTASAYQRDYRGCGCEDPAVMPFCEPAECLIRKRGSRGTTKIS